MPATLLVCSLSVHTVVVTSLRGEQLGEIATQLDYKDRDQLAPNPLHIPTGSQLRRLCN